MHSHTLRQILATTSLLAILGLLAPVVSAQSAPLPPPGPAAPIVSQLIRDPDFESGAGPDAWYWSLAASPFSSTQAAPAGVSALQHHCGQDALKLQRYDAFDYLLPTAYGGPLWVRGWGAVNGWAAQAVTIPSTAAQATLTFWMSAELNPRVDDFLEVGVYGLWPEWDSRVSLPAPLRVLDTFRPAGGALISSGGSYLVEPSWTRLTYDLSTFRGRTVQVGFQVRRGPRYPFIFGSAISSPPVHGTGGAPSVFWFDDVELWVAPHLSLSDC